MKIFGAFAWRLLRGVSSLGISAGIAFMTANPALIWLAPVISAAAKLLREKFGLKDFPL